MTTVDVQSLITLFTAIAAPIGSYWGAISAMRVEMARQEERHKALADRVDRLESRPVSAGGGD